MHTITKLSMKYNITTPANRTNPNDLQGEIGIKLCKGEYFQLT
jgi:hypothetical protein